MPYNRKMQPGEGYQYDVGPSNSNGGQQQPPPAQQQQPQQPPAGSRLSMYMGYKNRAGGFPAPPPPPPPPTFIGGAPININAPVFVPKSQQQQSPAPPPAPPQPFQQLSIHEMKNPKSVPFHQHQAASLQPHPPYQQMQQQMSQPPPPMHPHHHPMSMHPMQMQLDHIQHVHQPPPHPFAQQQFEPPQYDHPQHFNDAQARYQQENVGGTMYFFSGEGQSGQADQEHYDAEHIDIPDDAIPVNMPTSAVYTAPLPLVHLSRFRGKSNNNLQTQFISPEMRQELINRQLAIDTKLDPKMYPGIPPAVEHYSNLVPLENIGLQNQSQTTYKAFSCRDGSYYCLRRIHGFRILHPGKQLTPIEQWKKVAHGNVVPCREILLNCRAFDDSSLIFVYDYYPLAETLMARHFESKSANFYDPNSQFRLTSPMGVPMPITGTGAPENVIWSYVVQIVAGLRAIHSSGLACRTIELNKIITYGSKIMLSFCGIQSVINPDPQSIQHQQADDLIQFGNLLMALASGKPNGYRKDLYHGTMKQIGESYSADFKNLILHLHSANNEMRPRTITEVLPMIGHRFFNVIETMQARNDTIEAELSRELENGRLFRLLAKINTVLERVEHGIDEGWSETGDRFMLKLFRDYIFHQVTEQGKPWLDMAHIVQCLNKLDAGSLEKIEMVARGGDTQIIIDYATLKKCLDKSFRELCSSQVMMPRHLLPR
ncbi:unnamed protein product [Caenorhabditis sp. 36 PRJEB53466]|nr:unnamed protein product [Caenorhabditis sp. 36 PRJEB53466]